MSAHPYTDLEGRYFWSTAVAKRHMLDIEDLWNPKFSVTPTQRVVTYGSCFAQHIGRGLKERGFNWHIAETPPRGLSAENERKFNYGIFSARTGNIYTASLLLQWVDWALGFRAPPAEAWEMGGRFYDPFRPNIEPEGFESEDEVIRSRDFAIQSFRASLEKASVFVFTLGLTESWFHCSGEYEYPMCPGTAAGTYDAELHHFKNQDYEFIKAKLNEAIRKIRKFNPRIRILLTVSPVPLVATLSGSHVLVATTYAKSVLRAVAGNMESQYGFVDYFPSFEIINSAPFKGAFFEPNQRSVHQAGVAHVMKCFFDCLGRAFPAALPNSVASPKEDPAKADLRSAPGAQAAHVTKKEARRLALEDAARIAEKVSENSDVVCEEQILNAFSK